MNFGKFSRDKKLKKIDSKSSKIRNFTSSTIIKLVVFVVIAVGISAFAAGIGTFKAIIDDAPDVDTLLSSIVPEGYTSFIYDLNGNVIQDLSVPEANRVYVEIDQIPDFLSESFIAIEDERFMSHKGVDLQGVLRAIVTNLKAGSNEEGASTITQQVIKNNVLTAEVSYERKIKEMYLAIQLEKYLSKEKILELYMNTAACGRGTNGVQTASRLYFDKDVSDIDLAEAAVLASITNNPSLYDPVRRPENNRKRAVRILEKLKDQGYITEEEYTKAYNEDVYENVKVHSKMLAEASDNSYFVDEAINRVVSDLQVAKGITESQAYNLLYRGGLSIYITQDLEIQKIMDDVFTNEDNFPPVREDYAMDLKYSLSYLDSPDDKKMTDFYHEQTFDTKEEAQEYIVQKKKEVGVTEEDIEKGKALERALFIPQPQAAMAVIDYHNGYVKGISGGRGNKIGNQTFNRATQALRQPGSTFKVVAAYLPALDTNACTLGTIIDDAPTTFVMGGGSYSPKNWYRGYRGLSTVRSGIVNSMNILAVRTLYNAGIDTAYEYLLNLGFTSLHENIEINGRTYTDKTLSLCLGGLTEGVSTLELTAAYGAIANGGVYVEPIFYTKVLDHEGNLVIQNDPAIRTVCKDSTAYLLTDAMVDVISNGTGGAARFKKVRMPEAGKTGTTTSTKDLWFAGYTPYYAASVWMGYDHPERMAYIRSYHKYIWRDVMEAIHKELPYKKFEKPSSVVSAAVCSVSGMKPTDLCSKDPEGSKVKYELFAADNVPKESCNVHKEVLICKDSGLLANEYCPDSSVQTKVRRQFPVNEDPNLIVKHAVSSFDIPEDLTGEYCHIHGPNTVIPVIPEQPVAPEQPINPEQPVTPPIDTTVEEPVTPPTNTESDDYEPYVIDVGNSDDNPIVIDEND